MKPWVQIVERTGEVAGLAIRWLAAGEAPILYLHGVPNSADLWRPFLERTGGIAPDLPGFGRSAKRGDFDYSIGGYARFVEHFTAAVGMQRLALVVHDWGVVGLAFAQRFPERIDRLVLTACVPLLSGYRWHPIARIWRTPVLGELSMGFTSKWAARRLLPEQIVEDIWRHFDQGTQRAILRLYRSAPPHVLTAAGQRLDELRCPALVLWPTRDPYIPEGFGQAYADALGGEAELQLVEAGHWPWLDRPGLVARVAGFVSR
jgi:pimeloyl-ACP methyl ester carboxylesterase